MSMSHKSNVTQISIAPKVKYKTVKVDELDVFYREEAVRTRPGVLLLHGFPTSSHMFRNLIPALAVEYHVVAPDYPGFGQSRCRLGTNSLTPSTTWRT